MKIGRFEFAVSRTKSETPASGASGGQPMLGELAHSATSRIYRLKDFPRYNPDSLIGRKGFDIYKKMARDDAIGASIDLVHCATLARSFKHQIDANHPEAEKQEEFAEWCESMLLNFMRGTWYDKLIDIQTGYTFGFSLSEKIFDSWTWGGRTWWGLRDLKLRPFDTFKFADDAHGNVSEVVQMSQGQEIKIPIEKFVHFVNRPDVDPQFGESVLRDVYREWWSKDINICHRNLYLERMAGGFIDAEVEGALTPAETAELEQILKNFSSTSGVKHSSKVKLNIVNPSDTQAYERAIAQANRAIARRLMNPSLLGFAEQANTGSYSQSQSQEQAFFFVLNVRAQRIADLVNEQIFKDLALWNFGLTDPPPYVPEPMTDVEKRAVAEAYSNAVQKGADKPDEESRKHIRELLRIPARQETPEEEGGAPLSTRPDGDEEPDNLPALVGDSGFISKANMSSACRRVNFTAIDNTSEALVQKYRETLGATMDAIWGKLKAEITRKKLGTPDGDPAAIEALSIPKGLKAELRRHLRTGLKLSWKLGREQAAEELPAREFAVTPPAPGFDTTAAEAYLDARSFSASGDLTDTVLKDLRNALYTGLKYDKTTLQVMADLKPILAPYIPELMVKGKERALAARLETIVRTNFFDAINEARFSFFNDPNLDGFVEALEYTAILDSRTTDICEHMNGRIYPKDSREWMGKRPPNHHNCRSLLVAVTAIDEWKESKPSSPNILPAKGFM